jgi:hypothetical protein
MLIGLVPSLKRAFRSTICLMHMNHAAEVALLLHLSLEQSPGRQGDCIAGDVGGAYLGVRARYDV